MIGVKVEKYTVADQVYLIPAIKATYSRTLNGFLAVDLVWLKWGVSFMW